MDAPVSHLALEPSFGDSDALGEAIAAGSCLVVAAGATFSWSLAYESARSDDGSTRRHDPDVR